MLTLPHFINGAPLRSDASAVREGRNPSDASDVVATSPIGSAGDVARACGAAADALAAWRRTPGPDRAAVLHRWGDAITARADEIAGIISREVGKPIGEARGEVARATVICRYYAGEAVREMGEVIPSQAPDALQFTLRDPVGVTALITPWNFPIAIPLWKAAPAIAFGNTVVLKPSELSPLVAHHLALTAESAGIPPGVFNVVMGDGGTGEALLRDENVRAISFTGSQGVGRKVTAIAAERNVRSQTEMGGKNVVIVARDADLQRAATLTAAGAMRYAGQKCTATSRVIVERSVEHEFLRLLEIAVAALPLGPVSDPASAIGPLISEASRERVTTALRAANAETIFGGNLPSESSYQAGNWFAPVAIRLSGSGDVLARHELFAPVLGVLSADDIDHAIQLANESEFGLSASLFTSNVSQMLTYVRQIEVGLVRVNGDTTGVDPHAPFGGMKGSSSGSREQGRAARDFYTETRTIQIHS